MESFNQEMFIKKGIDFNFIQDNQSLSSEPGVIRGLHYQLNPKAQTKIIRVLTGAIYDVIVDVRKSSPTFGKWVGIILSEHNHRQLLVPKGFAHGFVRLCRIPKCCTRWTNIIPRRMTAAYYGTTRYWESIGRHLSRFCRTKTSTTRC